MAFSENLKLEVKHKAAFRCCRCNEIGIQVHHIVPQRDDGPDTIDNAAPLCPNCHDHYGGNPDKRKEIKQFRDRWYEVVLEKYPFEEAEKWEKVNDLILKLGGVQEDQATEIKKLKEEIKEALRQTQKINEEAFEKETPAGIKRIVSDMVSATKLGEGVHANVHCKKCNSYIGLLIGGNKCPTCGEPFE
jgi:DNA repair exonuclease SbcCD ATPase subunit